MATTPPMLAACQELVRPNGVILGSEIAEKTRKDFPSLLSTIPTSPSNCGTAFLASLDGRQPLTHAETRIFLQDFGRVLHSLGVGRGQRVALVLPNGPELALAILATAQWTGCVPLSATSVCSELEADLARCGPNLIIGPYNYGPLPEKSEQPDVADPALSKLGTATHVLKGVNTRDWTVHHHVKEIGNKLGIPFVGLVPDPDRAGPFKLWIPIGRRTKKAIVYKDLPLIPETEPPDRPVDTAPNESHNEALVLFTSGTTGNKKLVPHQICDLLTAATVIALSWQLHPNDVNCNMMPLFHVGGIVRQIFSPLVSGSCVICCPSFDASLFWLLLKKSAFNWYYAAPTMHQIILQTGIEFIEEGAREGKKYTLKMIANAAGGLLPSLALELRRTFQAHVLPR